MTSEFTVGTLDGQPLRASFPLRATVFGIDAVVIPAAEYDRLRQLDRERATVSKRRPSRPPPASTLDTDDPEVAAFVRERLLAGVSIEKTERAARIQFGRDRGPSWGKIRRFRLKVLAAQTGPAAAS